MAFCLVYFKLVSKKGFDHSYLDIHTTICMYSYSTVTPPPSITPLSLSKPNQTRLNLRQRFLRLLHFLFIFNLSFTLNHYLRLHHHWLLQPGYQIYWCPFLALPYPLLPRPNRVAAVIGCRSICSISNIHRCHCTAHHLPCHQLGKEEEEESAVESSTWWDLNSTSLEI